MLNGQRAGREAIGQRRTLQQFQDEGPNPLGFFKAVDRGNVWMIQRGEQTRFALEPGEPFRVVENLRGRTLMATSRPNLASLAR